MNNSNFKELTNELVDELIKNKTEKNKLNNDFLNLLNSKKDTQEVLVNTLKVEIRIETLQSVINLIESYNED